MLRHGCMVTREAKRNKRDEELGNEKPKIWICDECLAVNNMDKKCIECDASKPAPPPPLQIVESVKETEASETTIAAQGSVLSDEMAGSTSQREIRACRVFRLRKQCLRTVITI